MEYASISGVKLAYQQRGAGTPLVMIHGGQGDQSMFSDLASALASQYRVLTFDQRGSGLSEKPDAEYSIAMLADDTAALMDLLGYCPAHVLGVSMGGMIAQELALRHPAKVRSLVLGCTTSQAIPIGGSIAYSTQPMSAEDRGRALAEAAFTKGYIERHPQIIASIIEARRERPIDLAAFGQRLKAAAKHDTFERLARIKCPTLVVTGRDDALISWENSRLLAQRIPNAELVILEPAGHAFWLEQPEQSREAILHFLQAAEM